MKKRVADIVVDCLIENGITDCFSVVGGGAMHLNNALVLRDDIRKIYCHHEQACAMAAEGYAKVSGRMAAVCVTSGPGGLNTLNGVQGAYVDNTPMIVISGHPRYATTVEPTGLNLRYRGVQEFDIVNSVKKMTKYSKLVLEPKEIRQEVYKAIRIATTGRKGPVWLDIPLDIQSTMVEKCEVLEPENIETVCSKEESLGTMKEIYSYLKNAKRPCIISGSGIRVAGAIEKFREFASKLNIPVVGGAVQPDIMNNENELCYGISGSVGPRCGNLIIQNADLIIVIGNSLSYKQTGFKQEAFAPNAKILMLDIEPDEAKKSGLHVDKCYEVDLAIFFDDVNDSIERTEISKEWKNYCDTVREKYSKEELLKYVDIESKGVSSVEFWNKLLDSAEEDALFALGNSSCIVPPLVMGVNKDKQRVIVNYNSGSMGDDLPEAVGVAVATNKTVYCVTGDGSIMMNLQELQTILYNKLSIKIIVFSNDGYGAIRRTCKNFFNGTYTGCDEDSGISMPDFEKVSYAFNYQYKKCSSSEDIEESIKWLKEQPSGCILEVCQKLEDIVYPRLMSRMREDGTFVDPELHDMYPFLDDKEMKELMIGI